MNKKLNLFSVSVFLLCLSFFTSCDNPSSGSGTPPTSGVAHTISCVEYGYAQHQTGETYPNFSPSPALAGTTITVTATINNNRKLTLKSTSPKGIIISPTEITATNPTATFIMPDCNVEFDMLFENQ